MDFPKVKKAVSSRAKNILVLYSCHYTPGFQEASKIQGSSSKRAVSIKATNEAMRMCNSLRALEKKKKGFLADRQN